MTVTYIAKYFNSCCCYHFKTHRILFKTEVKSTFFPLSIRLEENSSKEVINLLRDKRSISLIDYWLFMLTFCRMLAQVTLKNPNNYVFTIFGNFILGFRFLMQLDVFTLHVIIFFKNAKNLIS